MSTERTPSTTLILCDCLGSQRLEPDALSRMTGLECSKVHSELCGAEAEAAARVIDTGNCILCCTQEERFFEELADELEADLPPLLDLRDRAGWTDDPRPTGPKMAALAAEATMSVPPIKSVDVESAGTCLVIGSAEVAGEAATRLKDILGVTLLLTGEGDIPLDRDVDVIRGTLRRAAGALGGFDLFIDRLQRVRPGGRGGFGLTDPQDGAQSQCDIILDLSGAAPLFPAPEKREGYLRADPGSPKAVGAAVLQASQLVGTFEKPLYVRMEPLLCAHSRAEQSGCTKCLDACPTGAISPAGDHVTVDPMICAGCGSCASLCPSGAIAYEAPPATFLYRRIYTLAQAYTNAGGQTPHLLAVDGHGAEMIRLLARYGAGLPSDVIPLEVEALNTFGHAEALAALAAGFCTVSLLPGPGTEPDALQRELDLARAIGGRDRVRLLETDDPDRLGDLLRDAGEAGPMPVAPVRPIGTRRQITRAAARALHPEAGVLALPESAPYGAVLVDTDACTLCLSCVSLCPSGALGDNPDLPQLRFQEDACLQCGLCANICPENAIGYERRLNLSDEALDQIVLHEEEPFACVECGVLFGSRSTIERITEKLAAHSMYQKPEALRMIQMCDNCRVNAQFHSEDNPFASGERPRTRTTEDYLSKRRDH